MIPAVTICIPTYRGAVHIAATIESVLVQSFRDFELVIIDDNSPDETVKIVSQFSDSRIRFLRNPINLGPQGNWNRCLKESRGRFFKLLPQDDVLYPDALARQVDVLAADTDERLALVFGARSIIDANGRKITYRGLSGRQSGIVRGNELVRLCVRRGTNLIGEPGAVMFRKALASRIGLFNARFPYVIDLDYWVRLLAHGDAYYMADPVSRFRVSRQSWSVAIGNRQSRQYRDFIQFLASDSKMRLSFYDITSGKILAMINNLLRLLFYKTFA